MKSFAVPEPCRDVGKMPRLSPAAARSNPAATPQTGPAVLSILFFMQHPSTVITWPVSAISAASTPSSSTIARKKIANVQCFSRSSLPGHGRCAASARGASARHPKHANSQENGMAEGSQLQPSVADTRQVRLPQLQIASYPQSYPYWAQRQSYIGGNALMAKGRRAVSRQMPQNLPSRARLRSGRSQQAATMLACVSDESDNYANMKFSAKPS